MKSTITVIQEFLEKHGLSIDTIDISLTEEGQVAYCTGTFKTPLTQVSNEGLLVDYKSKVSSVDRRFFDTELDITEGNQFIITCYEPIIRDF